ncbi:hypothetical protein [Cellulomonas sp. S1-8]|uniref:hypothetical protein n=1 Tax=Cellulomonas sp. S1-8 TaxID=2904790 RepID=UPI0022444ABA|nr:hypothetical protein [Cellulomonas sp. S1-8]UZN03447.1 hypothetical protein OKX07_00435 [Cellulomonas sp. S1-8]
MPSRTTRTRAVAVVVVAALVGTTLLGALAAFGGGSSPTTIDIPATGPWTVLVSGDLMTADGCTDDPAVSEGFVSPDAPTTSGGLVMVADAEVADVQRVVTCLADLLDPAGITVIRTSDIL